MTKADSWLACLVPALACIGSGACGPAVLGDLPTDTEGHGGSGSTTGPGADATDSDGSSADTGADLPQWQTIAVTQPRDLDVLVVLDDSAMMGPRQARLADALAQLVEILEDPEVEANFRIAFTTTDLDNPWCPETSPEDGAFVASSCASRLGDFAIDGGGQTLDVSADACLDFCWHDSIELLPTATAVDAEAKPRPWLEVTEGKSNLPEGITAKEAVRCLAPQGIAGCGFPSPLEAARRALERARTPGDPAYGFIRESAHLVVLFVTEGSDCSFPWDKRAIFLPPEQCYDADGDSDPTDDCTQAFWTDPDAPAPTPGVCWNAGVACTGASPEPDGTTSFTVCDPADKGLDGGPVVPADAVLHPISRYAETFATLAAEKAWYSPILTAVPAMIAGVSIDGATALRTSTDPAVNLERGIGPGCTDSDGVGLGTPPVRLAALVDTVDSGSICSNDYAPLMSPVVDAIRKQIRPACVERCVADLDSTTQALDFDCQVRQLVPPAGSPTIHPVPPCEQMDGSWVLPDGENVCWFPFDDASHATPGEDDDLHPHCADLGVNLEVGISRREGFPAPAATEVQIQCAWSSQPEIDCPNLP